MGGIVSQAVNLASPLNTQPVQQNTVAQTTPSAVQVPGVLGQALPFTAVVENPSTAAPLPQPATVQPTESLNNKPSNTEAINTLATIGATNNPLQQTTTASNNTDMLIQQLIEALNRYNTNYSMNNTQPGQLVQQRINPYTINPYSFGYGGRSLFDNLYSNNKWF